MRPRGGTDQRSGWVKAPPTVELEIRTVWQEDEMPEEITSSPGYIPFTLGPESQEWVDSMEEVVDGGNAVYGRPKPVAPPVHRQLATPAPPPTVQAPAPTAPAPRPPPAAPDPTPWSIRAAPPARKPAEMPEIGGPEPAPPARHEAAMPEIGAPEPAAPVRREVAMPEIATPRLRTLPKRVLMPEIGEEQPAPAMPEIGENGPTQTTPEIGEERKPPLVPEIGE